MQKKLNSFYLFVLLTAILLLPALTRAQAGSVAPMITQPVDEANLIVLHGNTHPLALPKYDRGWAPSDLPMQRMLLVLQRSPAQESALVQLLEQQQDNSSPSYHQWLTPEQFGAEYGPADQDIQKITTWLESHGFTVNRVSSGRVVIEFSGTAGQVAAAFHTEIRKYLVDGEEHWANASDPQIPTALAPVVSGVRSLHNFFPKAMNRYAGKFQKDKATGKFVSVKPEFTFTFNGFPTYGLAPYDLATIYDIAPLWTATTPIDGTGQTIAIVGETDINTADWTSFRSLFGISGAAGSLNVIHDGPAPGIQGDEPEADIDTQWSSAVAKGATIDFVVSQSTETTSGVDLSAEYIVDNNLAPVMSESYGICELFLGTSGNAYFNALWQQASAQGITVLLASGDQGSAVCDRGVEAAQFGLAVSGFSSTPYNISVGGTDFNDALNPLTYWNSTNNQTNQSSAKGYIPEVTWNDSCTNSEIFSFFGTTTAEQTCNNANVINDGLVNVDGGSGGVSNCTNSNGQLLSSCLGGYAKPVWQTGTGVPSDGKRDVPDVSLFASNGFNGSVYIICQSDANTDGSPTCDLNDGFGGFQGYGGTSVSSPAFAGIMALINQKTGERQGNANYVFYKMAAGAGNSCNSHTVSITGTNSCIFYDTPTGSTIAMPCATGSMDCTTSTNGDQFGVLSGYSTGTGYDLATGLGTVNVTNLVNQWSTYAGQFKATTISPFTLGPPTTITHGQSVPVAATVKPQTGTGTPTGTITLIANTGSASSGQQAVQQVFALTNGSIPASATTTMLPGGTNYKVTAHYSGDGTFAASDSAPFTMTVNPESSKTQSAIVTFNPATGQITSTNATSFPYGSSYLLRATATNSSGNSCASNGIEQYGCPTGTIALTDSLNGGAPTVLDSSPYTLNSEGYAEDQSIFLLGGQHSIVATYFGDNSYNASNNSAGPDIVTVNKAATTSSIVFGGSAIVGNPVSILAIASTQVTLPTSAPVTEFPTGAIQIFNGGAPIASPGSYNPSIDPNTGFAQLQADLTINSLPAGANVLTAQYAGDSNYAQSSLSPPVTVNVLIPTTTTLNTSNPTIQHGSNVTFTATVTPSQAGPALNGFLQLWLNCDGCILLGSETPVTGPLVVTTPTLPGGVLTIVATYGSDPNYTFSSAQITETVNLINTTTTVTSSSATIQQGASVTFTATVSPSGSTAPTGTVQFIGGGMIIGSPTLTNNQAVVTTMSLPAGSESISAYYSGDTNYAASSGSTTETVTPMPTFGATANPTTMAVTSPGAFGTATITFTGMNGYSGTIPLSASLVTGLPSETTCNFSVSSVALTGSGTTATAMVTCQTTAASNTSPQSEKRPTGTGWWELGGAFVIACIYFMGFVLVGYRTAWRKWSAAFSLFALASLLAIASCGGGGGGNTGPPPNPGTPVGLDQNVVVTFSGAGVTPSPTLNLSINVE